MGSDQTEYWAVRFQASKQEATEAASAIEEMWVPEALSISLFEADGGPDWAVEAFYLEEPEADSFKELLSATPSAKDFRIEYVPPTNWVEKSLEGLEPIQAGRFFVAGSHDIDKAPNMSLPLIVDAGEAFGTGHHGTTKGCLLEIERVLQRSEPRSILDLGTGSGLLAFAAAKLTRQMIVASDIDPIAVSVTKSNARQNKVAPLVRAVTAPGFAHESITDRAPYDLIIANILAAPLVRLAPQMAQYVAPGGRIILSGLLITQERRVLNAYVTQGFKLEHRRPLGEWMTLTLSR